MAVWGKVKTSLLLRWEGEHLAMSNLALARGGISDLALARGGMSDLVLARGGTSIVYLLYVFLFFFFQTKGSENKEKNCLGLYSYPVLMAADILLYR